MAIKSKLIRCHYTKFCRNIQGISNYLNASNMVTTALQIYIGLTLLSKHFWTRQTKTSFSSKIILFMVHITTIYKLFSCLFFSGYGSKRADCLRQYDVKPEICSHWELFCGVPCKISSVQASMLGRCPGNELGGCISWSWDEWRNLWMRSSIWNPIRSLRVIIPLALHIQNH